MCFGRASSQGGKSMRSGGGMGDFDEIVWMVEMGEEVERVVGIAGGV